jgi:hypothetical protein
VTPACIVLAGVLALQITAGQAPTEVSRSLVRTEVPDPMQIDVPLGADTDPRGQARPPFIEQPLGKARAYPETDRFVCDQAHVRMLTVKKTTESPSEIVIEASLILMSDWPLQDIDLTVALVSSDKKILGQQQWKRLTLGAWSRSYKPPKAVFHVPTADWQQLFSDGSAPSIRIVVDIQN